MKSKIVFIVFNLLVTPAVMAQQAPMPTVKGFYALEESANELAAKAAQDRAEMQRLMRIEREFGPNPAVRAKIVAHEVTVAESTAIARNKAIQLERDAAKLVGSGQITKANAVGAYNRVETTLNKVPKLAVIGAVSLIAGTYHADGISGELDKNSSPDRLLDTTVESNIGKTSSERPFGGSISELGSK
jgi:hypothetical protein